MSTVSSEGTWYEVTRAYNVRRYETIRVQMPEDFDPDDYSFGEVDEHICQNGIFLNPELMDDDDLDHLVWQQVAGRCDGTAVA